MEILIILVVLLVFDALILNFMRNHFTNSISSIIFSLITTIGAFLFVMNNDGGVLIALLTALLFFVVSFIGYLISFNIADKLEDQFSSIIAYYITWDIVASLYTELVSIILSGLIK